MMGEGLRKEGIVSDMLAFSSQYIRYWNGKLILVSLYINKVFLINLENYQIENMISIPYGISRKDLFRDFIVFEESLILVPFRAKKFIKIDLQTSEITEIDGILGDEEKNIDRKFLCGIQKSDHLWCIGEGIPQIICVNLRQLCTEQKKCINDEFEQLLWSDAYIVRENTIFVPSRNRNVILEINDIDKSVRFHVPKGSKGSNGFLDIAWIHDQIHLFDDAGLEYIWRMEEECVELANTGELEVCTFASRQCFRYKDKFFRVALYENDIWVRDKEGQLQRITFPDEKLKLHKRMTHFGNGCKVGRCFYIQSRYGYLFRIDMDTLDVVEIHIPNMQQVDERKADILQELFNEFSVGEGEEAGTIEGYIDYIKSWGTARKQNNATEFGRNIYDAVMGK